MSGTLRARLALAMGAVILMGAAFAAPRLPALALINESPSLPRGLYLRVPDAEIGPGAIVAAPQPASAQPYLGRLGMPPTLLLLKRVAAVGGERVCAESGSLRAPRRRVNVQARDRRGAPLLAWRGCRVLKDGELFLLGDTPSSFDSRYFGPVSRSEVTGVYREVLTW